MFIPFELSGKIKKPEFKVYYDNYATGEIEENKVNIYLYNHLIKTKKPFKINLYFRVVIFDDFDHELKIESSSCFSRNNIRLTSKYQRKINKSQNFKITAEFSLIYDYNINGYLYFVVDDVKENVKVTINQERKYYGHEITKYLTFPYKTLIKNKYNRINSKNKNEAFNEDKTVIYSPYCVKIYNSVSDIIFKPENKNSYEKIIEGIKIIIFIKQFNDYWVPNILYFGDDIKFDEYKKLKMNKDNINKAKDNICRLFNEIRSKHKYIFYMNYNYE